MYFNEVSSKLLALNETYLKFIHIESLENDLIITVLYYNLISFIGIFPFTTFITATFFSGKNENESTFFS